MIDGGFALWIGFFSSGDCREVSCLLLRDLLDVRLGGTWARDVSLLFLTGIARGGFLFWYGFKKLG